jgi:hypothetical protein
MRYLNDSILKTADKTLAVKYLKSHRNIPVENIKVHASSNYIKYGSFTITDGKDFVFKFYVKQFPRIEQILYLTPWLSRYLNGLHLTSTEFIDTHSFETHVVNRFNYEKMDSAVSSNWKKTTEELKKILFFWLDIQIKCEEAETTSQVQAALPFAYELQHHYAPHFKCPSRFTHGDLNLSNTLISNSRMSIIDFDNASWQPADLIASQILLMWLMGSVQEDQRKFYSLAEFGAGVISSQLNNQNASLILKKTKLLSQQKCRISVAPERIKYWNILSEKLKGFSI